jgi:preprotein translocase subunit SecG
LKRLELVCFQHHLCPLRSHSFTPKAKEGRPEADWFQMNILIDLIYVVHILVCFFLIIVVLLQSGKSGDIAAAFGGMGSQTAFGPRGAATALSKATTWSAVLFMVTSITLSIFAVRRTGSPASSGSVLSGVKGSTTNSQPAAPAQAPAAPSQPAPAK